MVNDVMMGSKGPRTLGGSPSSLWIYVEDADALFNRAVAAGGKVPPGPMGPMQDQFWGDRCGTFKDPEGYTLDDRDAQGRSDPEEMKRRQEEFFKNFASKQPVHH